MPWRGKYRESCKVCGRTRAEAGTFSARGKCQECGTGTAMEQQLALHEHQGPHFTYWRERCLAAFGVVVDTDDS